MSSLHKLTGNVLYTGAVILFTVVGMTDTHVENHYEFMTCVRGVYWYYFLILF